MAPINEALRETLSLLECVGAVGRKSPYNLSTTSLSRALTPIRHLELNGSTDLWGQERNCMVVRYPYCHQDYCQEGEKVHPPWMSFLIEMPPGMLDDVNYREIRFSVKSRDLSILPLLGVKSLRDFWYGKLYEAEKGSTGVGTMRPYDSRPEMEFIKSPLGVLSGKTATFLNMGGELEDTHRLAKTAWILTLLEEDVISELSELKGAILAVGHEGKSILTGEAPESLWFISWGYQRLFLEEIRRERMPDGPVLIVDIPGPKASNG